MVSDHDRIFEQNRQRLRRLAYRLLGSLADADDMVQDVYVRWQRAGVGELRAPEAWLTTVMTRLCVDRMRARSRERGLCRLLAPGTIFGCRSSIARPRS
jgi:RNA polymerase sigma-70 factor (ECF subfamily)